MLTSLQIGQNGRLGNQMFQYAALVGAAFTRGYEWKLQQNDNVDLHKVFKMKNARELFENDISQIKMRYQEPFFHYNPGIFLIEDNTDLQGYFQSPLYFSDCFEYLMEDFQFKDWINQEAISNLSNLPKDKILCSVHVRRGDYLKKSNYHPPCSKGYYDEAMNFVRDKTNNLVHFVCFGDDIDWIKDNICSDDCTVIEGHKPEVDLCMMSKCRVHIIANSSFSWWGAVLGNFRNVIAPKNWFGPEGPKSWDSLYISGWKII